LTEDIKNKTTSYSHDVHLIKKDGREFIIVGTAHISRQSADLVREVIEKEKPDVVCVELDERKNLVKNSVLHQAQNCWKQFKLQMKIKFP
jgi:pheromone shutdown protein TraB